MEDYLPPGFRFHPTDEELITYYLSCKVSDISFTCKAIVDVDLNKCEPWDLPGKASMGEKEWYFFNLRDRKYPTGPRANRATEAGYWKTTGKDKEIFGSGILVGMKKTLVFYKGRAPKGEKSNWVMHEYRLQNKNLFKPIKEEWVVCRVFQKSAAAKKPQPTSSSQPSLGSPCDANSIVNEFGDIELPNLNINANPSSGFTDIATQCYSNNFNHDHMNMMNLNLDFAAARDQVAASLPLSLTWPSTILSPNLSMNSFLLKALQLRNYQPRDVTAMDFLLPHNAMTNPQFGAGLSSNFQGAPSSSKVLDSMPQQQQQQQQEKQPFNTDSIW